MRHGISIWIDVPLDMVAKQIVLENFQLPAAETINGSYSEVSTYKARQNIDILLIFNVNHPFLA